MRLAGLLHISGGKKTEWDGARRRELLPFPVDGSGDMSPVGEEVSKWATYSLKDAILFKVFIDLTRSGLGGKEASDLVDGGVSRVETGLSEGYGDTATYFAKPRNFMCHGPSGEGDIFIARETYTADFIDTRFGANPISSRTWGGLRKEIEAAIENENRNMAEDHRETVAVTYYNLSAAERFVRNLANEFGIPEADDFGV